MQTRQVILLLTLALTALTTPIFAQRDATTARPLGVGDDRKAVMNRIKQSADYYWAEASATTADEAYAIAIGKLVVDIQAEPGGATIDSAAVVRWTQRIDIPRGANMRVFVYTPKNGISLNRQTATSATNSQSSAATTETTPTTPESSSTTAEATTAETTAAETTAAETTTAETTAAENNSTSASSSTSTSVSALATTDFDDLITTLDRLKQAGTIEAYGKCTRDNISQTADAYLVIIDVAAREVRAVLTPEQSGQRHNVATGRPDATTNYHRCNGLWVRAK